METNPQKYTPKPNTDGSCVDCGGNHGSSMRCFQAKAAEAIDYEAIANVCIPVLVDEKGAKYIQFSYGRKYGDLSYNYIELKDIVNALSNSPHFASVAMENGLIEDWRNMSVTEIAAFNRNVMEYIKQLDATSNAVALERSSKADEIAGLKAARSYKNVLKRDNNALREKLKAAKEKLGRSEAALASVREMRGKLIKAMFDYEYSDETPRNDAILENARELAEAQAASEAPQSKSL